MSLETARRVLRIEAEALGEMLQRLDARFEQAVAASPHISRCQATTGQADYLMTVLAPGMWLQRLTTREPSLDQLEVSIRALEEVLEQEGRLTPADRRVEVMA